MKLTKPTLSAAFLIILLVASSLLLTPSLAQTVQQAQPLQEWTQLQGDSSSARFSTGLAPESADIIWKAVIPDAQSSVVAFNGKVFVASRTRVYALDKDSGAILWNSTVRETSAWPIVFKLDQNHLVAGRSCLDIETGRMIWFSNDFSANAADFSVGCYSPEEKMYYSMSNSAVQAWDFSDPTKPPTKSWQTYGPGAGIYGCAVQYGDGKVFPSSFSPHQVALNARNGSLVWDTETRASMLFSGAYSNGKFFRGGTQDNTFYCFDASSGETLWTFNPHTQGGYWSTGCSVAYGLVYALNTDGNLYALNVTNGEVAWTYRSASSIYLPGAPIVADGKVYATTGQNASVNTLTGERGASEFTCLDAFLGKKLWTMPIQAYSPRDSIAVAYGNLYLVPGYINAGQMDSYSSNGEIWAVGAAAWSMFRADPQKTAVGHSGPADLTLLWSFSTSGAVTSSPCAADGRVYFGSQDTYVYCLNARSGGLIWRFKTNGRIESSPSVVEGLTYVVSDDGNLYCLNATNGSAAWTKPVGSNAPVVFASTHLIRSSPTVSAGKVYVGSVDGNVYCFDAKTGNPQWTRSTRGAVTSSPATTNGAVYVTSREPDEGALYKLNANNGSIIWRTALPYQESASGTDMHASPVVAGGMVFASANRILYYAVNAASGEVEWTYRCSSGRFLVDSPIYVGGKLYLNDASSLVCLNALTSDSIWSEQLGTGFFVSMAYADGKLYLASDLRAIYVVNATDGQKLSWFTSGSNFCSSPAVYEGRVYVGNQDWNLYCLANYVASESNVSLSLENADVVVGDQIDCSGSLNPGLSDATVAITLTRPNGEQTRIEAGTSPTGNYAFSFTPDEAGNWTLQAEWASDRSYYTSATSKTVDLVVRTVPTPPPTETPNATDLPTNTPAPTPVPFDQLKFFGIPALYVYIAVIALLLGFILSTALIYRKKPTK